MGVGGCFYSFLINKNQPVFKHLVIQRIELSEASDRTPHLKVICINPVRKQSD